MPRVIVAINVTELVGESASCEYVYSIRKARRASAGRAISRGWERIRTAVAGFADLSLATRPPNRGAQK